MAGLPVAKGFLATKVQRFDMSAHSFRHLFIAFVALGIVLSPVRDLRAARAYVIVDTQTGFVLDEQKSKEKLQVGSLTKVAMAMVVLDWAEKHSGDLNQVVALPSEAFVGTGENLVGFQPGDKITLRDLLYAALVQSDNIAAYTLAAHVGAALQPVVGGGSSESPVTVFVGQMNALARALRMQRTRFVNPHGIDSNERSLPYTTASDLARLARYAINKAGFRFYVSQKERQISFTRGDKKMGYSLRNTNELLGRDGIDGIKTGRTNRAGDCLILSAQRESHVSEANGRTTVIPRALIVVLLGSKDRFAEGLQLLGRGWELQDQWVARGRPVDPKKTL